MPKGRKYGGRDWKPGQSGNPKGKGPLPPEVRAIREMDKADFIRIMNEYCHFSREELIKRINNPATPMKELAIGSMMQKSVTTGDPKYFSFLVSYLIGKPKESIDISVQNEPQALTHERIIEVMKQLEQKKGGETNG